MKNHTERVPAGSYDSGECYRGPLNRIQGQTPWILLAKDLLWMTERTSSVLT